MSEIKKGPPATACPQVQPPHFNSSPTKKATYKDVKDGLFGRTAEVLAYIGFDSSYADGRHHLCPCSEVKLKISDRETGAGGCEKCGAKWTNQVDLASHLSGLCSDDMRDRLAVHFGISGHRGGGEFTFVAANLDSKQIDTPIGSPLQKQNASSPVAVADDGYSAQKATLSSYPFLDLFARKWAETKPPITVYAMTLAGVKFWNWSQFGKPKYNQKIIGIPTYAGPSLNLVNWSIYPVSSRKIDSRFQENGQWVTEQLSKRMAYGGSDRTGIFLSLVDRELILAGKPIPNLHILKSEGGSDLLALVDRIPVGENWIVISSSFGCRWSNSLDWLIPMLVALEPVECIVIPDCDQAGMDGGADWAQELSAVAPTKVIGLPFETGSKKDVRDYLSEGNGFPELQALIDSATVFTPVPKDQSKIVLQPNNSRPSLNLSFQESEVADGAVFFLGRLGWQSNWLPDGELENCKVYVRAGKLVDVVPCEDPSTKGRLTIRPMPTAIIRERITQACQLITESEDKNGNVVVKPERPPKWLVDAVEFRGSYNGSIRSLVGVIQSPTLRSDGTIIQVAGYDAKSGLIYQPNAEYPQIPESPSREAALRAANELFECLIDFPIVGDSDKSAWLAMVLSMIARPCIAGCVPMFAVDANCRGAGKSMLVDVASFIAYGHHAPRQIFTPDDVEQRKLITSVAMAASPCVLFDNIANMTLGGPAIDGA